MIKKVVAIRNIGRLQDCNAKGDVTFRELTLIFAENGRGKTTLADVFRSLGTGNGDHILGRRTLGSNFPPSACILIDNDTAVNFKDGKWDGAGPRLAIYDSTFIHENVYSGDHIDLGQKKNLYRVIVGEEGVTLARKVDEYDGKIRDANKDLSARAGTVKASVPSGMNLETFLNLPTDPEVSKKLAAKGLEVSALEKAKEIKGKASLAVASFGQLPTNFVTLIGKVLDDVSKDAETAVKNHLATHAKPGGEEWLAQGLTFSNGKGCPFCGQSIADVSLLADYQKYFSQSYAAFKSDLANLQRSVEKDLGDTALLVLQGTLSSNAALVSFWSQFVGLTLPELAFDEIKKAVGNLRRAALARLKLKRSSPLEPVPEDAAFGVAQTELQAIVTKALGYNAAIIAANASISAKKAEMETGNLAAAKAGLALLLAMQKRYEAGVVADCAAYSGMFHAKAILDSDKAAAKAKLDAYSEDVVERYEKRINKLLCVFGAGFRIGETKTSYAGGSVSSSFQILINNVPVVLGDAATPAAKASFKNTLSAGDRSTLALAFFIAQLESVAKLSETVVLFDDPFTSQDRSRRMQTKQEICRIATIARQVVVMSHEPEFLKRIKDAVPSGTVRTLQMLRLGEKNSTICEADLDTIVLGEYFQYHAILSRYLFQNNGDPLDRMLVAKSIRPLLEGYLRVKLVGNFGPKEWIGEMISKIRDAAPNSLLGGAKAILEDLDAINEYSKQFHHGDGAAAETDPIDDIELRTFVQRTLDVVGGF